MFCHQFDEDVLLFLRPLFFLGVELDAAVATVAHVLAAGGEVVGDHFPVQLFLLHQFLEEFVFL
jgi:hypothetical protein